MVPFIDEEILADNGFEDLDYTVYGEPHVAKAPFTGIITIDGREVLRSAPIKDLTTCVVWCASRDLYLWTHAGQWAEWTVVDSTNELIVDDFVEAY